MNQVSIDKLNEVLAADEEQEEPEGDEGIDDEEYDDDEDEDVEDIDDGETPPVGIPETLL